MSLPHVSRKSTHPPGQTNYLFGLRTPTSGTFGSPKLQQQRQDTRQVGHIAQKAEHIEHGSPALGEHRAPLTPLPFPTTVPTAVLYAVSDGCSAPTCLHREPHTASFYRDRQKMLAVLREPAQRAKHTLDPPNAQKCSPAPTPAGQNIPSGRLCTEACSDQTYVNLEAGSEGRWVEQSRALSDRAIEQLSTSLARHHGLCCVFEDGCQEIGHSGRPCCGTPR